MEEWFKEGTIIVILVAIIWATVKWIVTKAVNWFIKKIFK